MQEGEKHQMADIVKTAGLRIKYNWEESRRQEEWEIYSLNWVLTQALSQRKGKCREQAEILGIN